MGTFPNSNKRTTLYQLAEIRMFIFVCTHGGGGGEGGGGREKRHNS